MNAVWITVVEVFKKIFSSKIFWYGLAILGVWLLVKKFFFGNSKSDVVSYIPESELPDKTDEFKLWAKRIGYPMAEKLGGYLNTWHIHNFDLDVWIYEMSKYNDNQLIYVMNTYNQLYYSNNKGTLEKDLADVTYFWVNPVPASRRDDLVLRLQKLSTK